MPEDYPVETFIADFMAVLGDNLPYIVPSSILVAVVAFILRWFFYAVNIGDLTFGKRR